MPAIMLVKEKERKMSFRKRLLLLLPATILLSLTAYWLDASGLYHFGPKTQAGEIAGQKYRTSIREYLETNLYNWESYEPIETGSLKPVSDSTFVTYHKFRNKNSYGEIVENNIKFYINGRGQVYKIDENY